MELNQLYKKYKVCYGIMDLAHHNKYNKVVPTQIFLEIQLSIVFKRKFPKMWLFMCNGWGFKVNETPVI